MSRLDLDASKPAVWLSLRLLFVGASKVRSWFPGVSSLQVQALVALQLVLSRGTWYLWLIRVFAQCPTAFTIDGSMD